MAAALVPLIAAGYPILKPVILSLVTHIEHLFGAKTGPTKLKAVLDALSPIAAALGVADCRDLPPRHASRSR